jgi:hypothetical protein
MKELWFDDTYSPNLGREKKRCFLEAAYDDWLSLVAKHYPDFFLYDDDDRVTETAPVFVYQKDGGSMVGGWRREKFYENEQKTKKANCWVIHD